MDRILLIESSGKVATVALASDSRILAERQLPETRRHARDLALRTSELLNEAGWKARDLTGVIVSIGPGSYTGLRVGVVSAKTLAYAIGCPLYGVPTFDAIAEAVPVQPAALELIADALQGLVYCQRYAAEGEHWRTDQPLRIRSFAEWSSEVTPGTWVAGPAAGLARAIPGVIIADEHLHPTTTALLKVAQRVGERYRTDPMKLEPLYLRGSSAEEKRKADGLASVET